MASARSRNALLASACLVAASAIPLSARATAQEPDTRAAVPRSRCVDRAMRMAQPAPDSIEVRGTWTARRIPELIYRIKAVTKPCENILFADATATGGTPFDVALSADGATAYVSDSASGGNIFVIDTASSSSTVTTLGPGPHTGIALNPSGTRLYVADDSDPGSVTIGTPPP